MYDFWGCPIYLLTPRSRVYFVAAEETMKRGGWLPRLFALGGAVTVTRTWRSEGKDVSRKVVKTDIDNINRALSEGWVITFPQGTTAAYAPGRKGTAHIIRQNRPVVVPVVIDGFRRAFDKKGLLLKPPMKLDYDASNEVILEQVMDAIEQSDRFRFLHYRKSGSDEA
jgi:1-acyl-sn-glycerol-3-phosphate acyltransferase